MKLKAPHDGNAESGCLEIKYVFNPSDTIRETADFAESEQTVVCAKAKPLYSIEVWRDGVREAVIPIMKQEISIGRGSRSVCAGLPIKGDPEVSRVHAVLSRDNEGRYWLVAKGRNATMDNGARVATRRGN